VDFRPVSILNVLSKALEKVVHNQLYDFVTVNNILNPCQSGFRKHCSTKTALLKVSDDVRKAIDDRKITLLVLLDMSKAFDCVEHSLLISKLRALGFSESVLNWFINYLSDRFQRVVFSGSKKSYWGKIKFGVPQGSVLGPLLFLLYINDLSVILKSCSYHIYADDIQLYLHFDARDIVEAVKLCNSDTENVIEFLLGHNLKVNIKKTQPIIIGTARYLNSLTSPVPSISIYGVQVSYCTSVNNLGVTMDCTLSWKTYVSNISAQIFASLAQFKRNFSFMPHNIRKRVVQSLLFPIIDYGLILCTNMSKETSSQLQRAQNACIRFVCQARVSDHVTPLYSQLGWLKIEERQTLAIALLIWKIMKYQVSPYLFDMFQYYCPQSSVNTRSNENNMRMHTPRTETFKKSFQYIAASLWNKHKIYNFTKDVRNNKFKVFLSNTLHSKYS
jgi:hypothetical protein